MKEKILTVILIILIIMLISLIGIKHFNNLEISNKKNNLSNIEEVDYKIAELLFSNYLSDEYNANKISEAFYNSDTGTFKCSYISKTYNNMYDDSITFITSDFVNYSLSATNYKKDANKKYVPQNFTVSSYDGINNNIKNQIISLAKEKGYHAGDNLTDDEFKQILSIVLENDTGNLSTLVNDKVYVLKKYNYMENRYINFYFEDSKNSNNYIELKCGYNMVDYWSVFGSSDTNNLESSSENSLSGKYYIDYNFLLNESSLSEVDKILGNLPIKEN